MIINVFFIPHTECNCDSVGSVDSMCGARGQCLCHRNFAGFKCNQCAPGYYSYPSCLREYLPFLLLLGLAILLLQYRRKYILPYMLSSKTTYVSMVVLILPKLATVTLKIKPASRLLGRHTLVALPGTSSLFLLFVQVGLM